MSDSEDAEVESIREQKREELAGSGAGTPDEPIHLEDEDHFESLLADHGAVLVDFYADWCGPCDMLEPIVEEVAAESDAAVAKLDIDELQSVAQSYGVRSVPTLIVFADGEQADQLVGVQEKETILQLLDRVA